MRVPALNPPVYYVENDPVAVTIDGRPRWRWPDGYHCPRIAGGSDLGPGIPPAPPTPTPPAPASDPTPPAGGDRTFTQAEVEALVQDRLARDRKGAPTADELADLRKKAGELDELKRQGMDDMQKAQTDLASTSAERDQLRVQLRERDRRDAIVEAARKANAVNPSRVADILASNPAVTIDDAGQVQGAETAVETLKASDAYLFGSDAGGGGGSKAPDFGQGHRGKPGAQEKGSVAAGADLFAQRHGKTTTSQ